MTAILWQIAPFFVLHHLNFLFFLPFGVQWDSTMVAAEGKYPRHSALARKEQLFKEAIQLLDLGKCWEVGIRLCKELATHYEMEAFDYHKLGAILVRGL